MEEVFKNVYRIGVVMPKNPLKELNSYFIRGDESDLLIDTGFRRDECRQALVEGLEELGSDPSRRDVLLTHLHSDHSGLANEFVGKNRTVYMSGIDIDYLKGFISDEIENDRRRLFLAEGFPESELDECYATNPAKTMSLDSIGSNFRSLAHGDELRIGDYRLKTVLVSGHTPGNTIFWMEREQVMFTGDHLLFDITPNIMVWPGFDDALGSYMDNLRLVRDYPVEIALPGHRKPGNYHARIDELLLHHEKRIDEALKIVKSESGLNAYEIAGRMTWRIRAENWQVFPIIQKWYAVGECLSHLDYLRKRGKVYRDESVVPYRYTALQ